MRQWSSVLTIVLWIAIFGVSTIFRQTANSHQRKLQGPWDGRVTTFSSTGVAVRENSTSASPSRSFEAYASVERPPGRDRQDEASADEIVNISSAFEDPLSLGSLDFVGHSGRWYARYPLGVCKGDCTTDDDCEGDLYCFQRRKFEPSPYCKGGEEVDIGADFCTWNPLYPPPEPDPIPPLWAFRLKLYWEEGYFWQNETLEREWCMIYNYDGYPGSGECWHGDELKNCTASQVYIGACLEGDPRQWFTFEPLGPYYSGHDEHPEVLIKTMSDWCLYRHESALYLNPECDPKDERQRFFALSGSFDPGSRFELGQFQGYTHENCLTNAHHPKSGEVIEFHICEFARHREDQTSFWQIYSPTDGEMEATEQIYRAFGGTGPEFTSP
ncbi:expressed unknown protein [Seminavis robusta]|uniref:Uncharacterized protein n=1 Tax=Seminavis robusta TaxID=568900 RepID=A0A9N8HEA2_9STRA|nr:expressed unknown protein [Seminavis robusta]|eukprot:Sro463_g148130.1 n/a (385) ;mRNA; f:10322-11724